MEEQRTFVDVLGATWRVWEVYPRLVERRALRERRVAARQGAERRHVPVGRPTLPRQILAGWLAFQSQYERRRVLPVPDDWEQLSDRDLVALLAHSKATSRPRAGGR
ncbi:MAG: hypothetical protein ABJA80_11270 [bacterium]